jgi:hypothetical protein
MNSDCGGLKRCGKSSPRSLVTKVGQLAYWSAVAVIFVWAAWLRFRLPLDPLADADTWGYLSPALRKLVGSEFGHTSGRNFIYPGCLFLLLRAFRDFRAISVIQHFLGLIAGGLFLATWSRLADLFPRPRLNRVAHTAIGLFGAAIYLLSNGPIFFEMQIRPDAVCMFFEMLIFWVTVQFFYYRVISPNAWKGIIYGIAIAINAFILASLKPSFMLLTLFAVASVIWLILNAKGNFIGKVAFFGIALPIIVALTLVEHYLSRSDQTAKMFLPETLFVFHAKIIEAQMAADLKSGDTDTYSREWLEGACDDLETEIQRTHNLYSDDYRSLGFGPDRLRSGADSLLHSWRRQLGDERFLRFLKYWYWHSVAHCPLAFIDKIAGQLGVFYSTNCRAFSSRTKWPLSLSYARSLAALSHPQSLQLLSKIPAGSVFLERTQTLRFSNIVVHQNRGVQICNVCSARTYLAILFVSVPLAGWFVLKRSNSEESRWPGFFLFFLRRQFRKRFRHLRRSLDGSLALLHRSLYCCSFRAALDGPMVD